MRHDELGPAGYFPPSVLTGVLQESAIDGSAATGFPFAWYLRERAFWVIRRITFRHERPLRYGDSLEVTTWVSTIRKTSSTREYRLESPSRGETIGRARVHWVYVDATTGQPKPLPESIRVAFAPTDDLEPVLEGVPDTAQRLDPGRPAWTAERFAEPGDVDLFGHVKCCRYVNWLEDLMGRAFALAGAAPGTASLASFDLQLLSSARGGETVQARAHADPVWSAEMVGPQDRLVARAALWPCTPDPARRVFASLDADLAARLRAGPRA